MSADPRPWWASDPDEPSDDDLDPVTAHRAARRGRPHDEPDAGRRADRDASERADGGPVPDPPTGHDPDVCGMCPICTGLRLLGEARPELLAHLTEAARHLTAALRSVVDPPAPPDGSAGFERIDLDRDPDDGGPRPSEPSGAGAERDRPHGDDLDRDDLHRDDLDRDDLHRDDPAEEARRG